MHRRGGPGTFLALTVYPVENIQPVAFNRIPYTSAYRSNDLDTVFFQGQGYIGRNEPGKQGAGTRAKGLRYDLYARTRPICPGGP